MEQLQNVRIECLKLANTKAVSAADVVAMAKTYENYVTQEDAKIDSVKETSPVSKSGKKVKSGNLDILS